SDSYANAGRISSRGAAADQPSGADSAPRGAEVPGPWADPRPNPAARNMPVSTIARQGPATRIRRPTFLSMLIPPGGIVRLAELDPTSIPDPLRQRPLLAERPWPGRRKPIDSEAHQEQDKQQDVGHARVDDGHAGPHGMGNKAGEGPEEQYEDETQDQRREA